jgi:hypothetical protein
LSSTVVELVRTRRGLGASDLRDIIYGHMGLARWLAEENYAAARWEMTSTRTLPQNLFDIGKPDYRKSIEDVFMDFAHDVINQCGQLSIFHFKQTLPPSEERPGLASWAPDWSIHPLKQPQQIQRELARLSNYEVRHSWIPNSRLLLLAGGLLSPGGTHEILEVSEIIPWNAPNITVLGDDQRLFAQDLTSFMDTFGTESSNCKVRSTDHETM